MRAHGPPPPASALIDQAIDELGDWRGKTLAKVRKLILAVDAEIVEEWKWGIPVWSRAGIICTGESYKSTVKLTFAKGASLRDPSGLFNSSLEGNVRRAIDIRESDKLEDAALKALIRAAITLNLEGKPKAKSAAKPRSSHEPGSRAKSLPPPKRAAPSGASAKTRRPKPKSET